MARVDGRPPSPAERAGGGRRQAALPGRHRAARGCDPRARVGSRAPYHHGLPRHPAGTTAAPYSIQGLSCVTGACMALGRDAYEAVGGFDEGLAIAFNDVDLCLRLREAGWRIVLAAGAELLPRRVDLARTARLGRPARSVRGGVQADGGAVGAEAARRPRGQPEPRPRPTGQRPLLPAHDGLPLADRRVVRRLASVPAPAHALTSVNHRVGRTRNGDSGSTPAVGRSRDRGVSPSSPRASRQL